MDQLEACWGGRSPSRRRSRAAGLLCRLLLATLPSTWAPGLARQRWGRGAARPCRRAGGGHSVLAREEGALPWVHLAPKGVALSREGDLGGGNERGRKDRKKKGTNEMDWR